MLLLLLLHDPRFIAAPRSAMLIRDAYLYAEIPEKNVPLRCSISFIWRSGLPRGAVTKNINFTVPRRVEEFGRRISRGCKLCRKKALPRLIKLSNV